MMRLLTDLRSAIRWCRHRPGFAIFAVATLALAIAAATSVFTLVNAALVRALPFRDPDRLVWMWNARVERDRAPFSLPDLIDYRDQNHVLDGIAPFTNWAANLTGVGEAERLEGVRVAPEFFDLLGATPALGRLLHRGDDPLARVAVLTDRVWRRRFGADRSIVGAPIVLNGVPYTVAAVLPPRFVFPFRDADVAVPLALDTDPRRAQRGAGFLRVVARLKPGVTLTAAKADLDAIGRRLQQEYPVDDAKKNGVNLYSLHAEIVGDGRQLLLMLFAAVAMLLLVACANLTNLFAVALSARSRELATRRALGATRARLVRQLMTEITALAVVGGTAGLVLSTWTTRAVIWWAGQSLAGAADVTVDGTAAAFAVTITTAAAIGCGVVPAMQATRDREHSGTIETRSVTSGAAQQQLRRAFVALQISASLVLLVAVGLTARSVINLQRRDPGFSGDALAIQLSLPPTRYATVTALTTFADRLKPRLQSLPSVEQVSAISLLPLSGLLRTEDFRVDGRDEPSPDAVPQAHLRIVLPDYFRAMGIQLLAGREFSDHDRTDGAPVAVVGRSMADRFWPDGHALGGRLRLGYGTTVDIVGVAADVKQFTLEAAPTLDLYVPLSQMTASDAPLVAGRMSWVVRGTGDPDAIVGAVRRSILSLDSEIASSSVKTSTRIVADALAPRRFNATMLALFGQAALLLAALGVYAVTAFATGARTRELGIRTTFGATPRDLLVLVFRTEAAPIAIGLALGLAGAVVAARLLTGTLVGVTPLDPATFSSAIATLVLVAVAAIYVPARKAARADPLAALRDG